MEGLILGFLIALLLGAISVMAALVKKEITSQIGDKNEV